MPLQASVIVHADACMQVSHMRGPRLARAEGAAGRGGICSALCAAVAAPQPAGTQPAAAAWLHPLTARRPDPDPPLHPAGSSETAGQDARGSLADTGSSVQARCKATAPLATAALVNELLQTTEAPPSTQPPATRLQHLTGRAGHRLGGALGGAGGLGAGGACGGAGRLGSADMLRLCQEGIHNRALISRRCT